MAITKLDHHLVDNVTDIQTVALCLVKGDRRRKLRTTAGASHDDFLRIESWADGEPSAQYLQQRAHRGRTCAPRGSDYPIMSTAKCASLTDGTIVGEFSEVGKCFG